jgi:hypothetical protein
MRAEMMEKYGIGKR